MPPPPPTPPHPTKCRAMLKDLLECILLSSVYVCQHVALLSYQQLHWAVVEQNMIYVFDSCCVCVCLREVYLRGILLR